MAHVRPPKCCVCGSKHWIAAFPGSVEQLTGDDPNVLLAKPIPAVPSKYWCMACWTERFCKASAP
jgi:hypothetical protein